MLKVDESTVLTGSSDETARLWDVNSATELKKFQGHAGKVASEPHMGSRASHNKFDIRTMHNFWKVKKA